MSVGAALSEARQRAQLSVAQLSDRTRIREAIIEGIERDDFSVCGGDFYTRGHIRALASSLGLEPEAVVREYDETHGASRPPLRAAAVFAIDPALRGQGRRTPNWMRVAAVALALVVVFVLVRLIGGSGGKADETAVKLPVGVPHHAKARDTEAARPAADLVVLKVFARKPSWIYIKDGKGHPLFQGTLTEGKTTTWKAKNRMKVVFGDAGAVRLEVNGKDLGIPGKDGQTVRRTFAAGGPSPR
ncbi:helix-turn-helix domain-containing protein [Microbispora sp. NPDC049125]|uniref:helix-turn-helix domain-containing protein n=1 Tax=Microbispora sp. NPDC049125 TaxID=3154929 RepID=UPI00346578C6